MTRWALTITALLWLGAGTAAGQPSAILSANRPPSAADESPRPDQDDHGEAIEDFINRGRAAKKPAAVLRGKDVPWYRRGYVALGAVLSIAGALAYLFRRFVPGAKPLRGSALQVVSRTYLSPKQFVGLVKMGRRLILIGVTPERITPLVSVDDPDQVADILGKIGSDRDGSASSAFDRFMAQEAAAFQANEKPADASDDALGAYLQTDRALRHTMAKVRSAVK